MNIQTIVVRLMMLLTIMPIHEYAHAAVANRLGDSTAQENGRLSLNPLRHLDFTGTIGFLLIGIGWGKPVPVYGRNLRHPRRDMALIALAGPVSNVLMTLVLLILYRIAYPLLVVGTVASGFWDTMLWLILNLASTSAYWAVFNLLPVPPLDGSRLLEYILPPRIYAVIERYQRFIYVGMLLLLITGLLRGPLSFVSNLIMKGLIYLTSPIDMLMHALL